MGVSTLIAFAGIALAGTSGRVWVVLTHDSPAAWAARFPQGVSATRISLPGLGDRDGLFLLSRP